jgi:formate dehydrogenase subunit gamma
MSTLDAAAREKVIAVIAELKDQAGPILPVLHGVQNALGYVPPEAVALVAEGLNVSRADVHGVVTFYHYFRHEPPGRHTIHLCRAESCQAMNGAALESHAKTKLGVGFHQTTSSGAFTLEPVYCLGNCACSPAVMVDGEVYGRVTADRFDEIVSDWERR